MITFDISEYRIKGCIIPCICFILVSLIVIVSIIKAIKTYKTFSVYSLIKRFFLLFFPTMIAVLGIPFLAIIGQTLKYGIFLIGESSTDAILRVGEVESIEPLSIPPQYSINKFSGMPAEVKIDGTAYYVMSDSLLSQSDTIEFSFLPKSKMILSYQSISYAEYADRIILQQNDKDASEIDPIFAIVVISFMILFAVFSKFQYFDRRLERKIRLDDEHWDKNEIRFHPSYIKGAIVFSVIVLCAVGVLSVLFSNFVILFLAIAVIVLGLAIMLSEYKNWQLSYAEDKIILSAFGGKQEIISLSNVVSVDETLENSFLSKGFIYRIVKIQYRTVIAKQMITQTVKLHYRFHVGIPRFLAFYRTATSLRDESN